MGQVWRQISLLHWPVAPEVLGSFVPEPLALDTLDGDAWITLTPFSTTCEVAGRVSLPGPRRFPETNLRTYVRGPDGRDGLLFLSLDVANPANAALGRAIGLPYFLGEMTVDDAGGALHYTGRRRCGADAAYAVTVVPGAAKSQDALDVFLIGRWSAYVPVPGLVVRHDVHHAPWPLREAQVVECREHLSTAAGVDLRTAPPALAHYAPEVAARLAPANVVCRVSGMSTP